MKEQRMLDLYKLTTRIAHCFMMIILQNLRIMHVLTLNSHSDSGSLLDYCQILRLESNMLSRSLNPKPSFSKKFVICHNIR